jgi:hypothetical protein
MKKLDELIEEQDLAAEQERREKCMFFVIQDEYKKEHQDTKPLQNCFQHQATLREIIKDDYRWDLTKDGFVIRTNFSYDENTGEIDFTSHYITRDGIRYMSDGSDISNSHLQNHIGDFAALEQTESIIAGLCSEYKDAINQTVSKLTPQAKVNPNYLEDRKSFNNEYTNMYLRDYGSVGRILLIKWLNRLTDPYTPIEDLAIEFKADIESAKLYLEEYGDENYKKAKASHIELESVLFRVLERFSPRGAYLQFKYRKAMDERQSKRAGK